MPSSAAARSSASGIELSSRNDSDEASSCVVSSIGLPGGHGVGLAQLGPVEERGRLQHRRDHHADALGLADLGALGVDAPAALPSRWPRADGGTRARRSRRRSGRRRRLASSPALQASRASQVLDRVGGHRVGRGADVAGGGRADLEELGEVDELLGRAARGQDGRDRRRPGSRSFTAATYWSSDRRQTRAGVNSLLSQAWAPGGWRQDSGSRWGRRADPDVRVRPCPGHRSVGPPVPRAGCRPGPSMMVPVHANVRSPNTAPRRAPVRFVVVSYRAGSFSLLPLLARTSGLRMASGLSLSGSGHVFTESRENG